MGGLRGCITIFGVLEVDYIDTCDFFIITMLCGINNRCVHVDV